MTLFGTQGLLTLFGTQGLLTLFGTQGLLTLFGTRSVYIFFLLIETYLYRVDIISSQAIFHIRPVVILTKFGFQHVWAQQGVGNEDVFFEVLCLRLKIHFKIKLGGRYQEF